MSDQERIHAMLEEGKISQKEAERLLAALQDIEGVEAEMKTVERDADTAEPDATVPIGADAPGARAEGSASLPEGLRWVRISMLAGDLDVRGETGLSEPSLKGETSQFGLEQDGRDYVVRPHKRNKDKGSRREGFDGFIDGVSEFVSDVVGRMGGDLDLRVPEGFGVVIESKAGDVNVRDVAFVKASLVAGDLDLRNVGGIDLSMGAGDVDASLQLTRGRHRIKVSAGDVDVRLLEGSSVKVTGGVSMGDVDAEAPFAVRRSGMGGQVSGQLGGGEAELELSVSAGDLDVRHG